MRAVTGEIVPDSQHRSLLAALPGRVRNFAVLARLDRPIGWWLLFWPCAWAVLLAGGGGQWGLIAWMLLGAIAMRGAGCVYNDIVDADLDRQVVAPVAAYPFMKRITWWPQAWLGLVFSWGALVGWTDLRSDRLEVLAALYAGSIFWVIGYDTIYAVQDREDDALVGIRSSALRMGSRVRAGVAAFYAAALACWGLAFWWVRPDWLALVALVPMALHLAWQVASLDASDADNALARFRSNRFAGLLMALACWVVGNA
ncbi:MAG: UbiA family prenyltransferase [Novosphingobium sp.]|nr:UbiA family prenyltransferase [Novosphingobium sp.]